MKQILGLLVFVIIIWPSAVISQNINQTDANGQKQGIWTKTYSNGVPRYEGKFKNNHPIGEFKYYYESGNLKAVTVFSSDGIVARTKTYHENNLPMAEGKYIKQKRDSIWLFYSDVDGELLSSETYRKGVLNGTTKTYYPKTGNVAEKIEYVKGIKQGPYRKYFPEGEIMTEGIYVNDNLDGDFTLYHPNGKIQIKGKYKDGRQVGNWEYFDENGNPLNEEDFKKDNQ
ncbi:MAG: hypothetical protein C0598_03170 [Marinilabiliales bacterium]|nr:MAG: hypothetical protein C0598_03170 [Marinilabiliales bacterium]